MSDTPLKSYTLIDLESMVKNVLDNKELTFVGSIDASTNPMFPIATPMDVYWISKSGHIGGSTGKYVIGSTTDARCVTIMICIESTSGGTYKENVNKWLFFQDNNYNPFNEDTVLEGYVLGDDESSITNKDSLYEAISKLELKLNNHIKKIASSNTLGHLIKNSKSAFDIQADGTINFKKNLYIDGIPLIDDPVYFGDLSQIINKSYLDLILNHSHKEYGVRRLISSSNPTLERVVRQNQNIKIGSATGLVANVGVDTQVVENSFDNLLPWKYITRCTIINGTVIAIEGDPNFTTSGEMGDVFVRIPRFYQMYQYNPNNDGYEYWWISNDPLPGYYLNPRFINLNEVDENGDNTTYSFIYIAAYLFSITKPSDETTDSFILTETGIPKMTKKYVWDDESTWVDKFYWTENDVRYGLKGSKPASGNNISELHSILSNIGSSKYSLQDIWIWDILSSLMIVEFGTLNLQSIIAGQSNLSSIDDMASNGACDNIVASSGSINSNTNGLNPFKYRGIENPYGTFNMLLDGAFTIDTNVMVCTNPSKYSNIPTIDYKYLNFTIPAYNGYVSRIQRDATFKAIQLPYEALGSSSTYFSDYYTYASGTHIICAGGAYDDGGKCGMFNFNISYGVADSNKLGTRLICTIPE